MNNYLNKKTILILGASGRVGSDLANYLSIKNKVVAVYRRKKNTNFKKNKNIILINYDLKNDIKIKYKPDVIINCVVTHPFSKKNEFKDYINSNIISLKNILDFGIKQNTKLIINLSSIAVHGSITNKQLTESTKINNPDLLGLTKIISEKLLFNQKINFINLRLPGILVTSFDKERPWLNTIISKIMNNENINLYNPNSKFNNLIDTYEIFKFIEFIIRYKKNIRDNFLFCASNPVKLIILLKKIKKKFNSKSKFIINKNDSISFTISNKKIQKCFKFKIANTNTILNRYLLNFNILKK